jgi:hypothetical protein
VHLDETLWSLARAARRGRPSGTHEGQTAEQDGKSHFGDDQKNIIKLSLFWLLPLHLKMLH